MASAEDVVLHKLAWYRSGGAISGRHWKVVLGILEVQPGRLDLAYLGRWADELGLNDLLQSALSEAGDA